MKPKLVILILLFVIAPLSLTSRAEPFSVPPMGDMESGTITTSYNDSRTKWTADWSAEKYSENGNNFIKITYNGKGLLHPFSEYVTWVSESVFNADGAFIPVSTVSTVKDINGKLLQEEKKTVNLTAGSATFVREDFTGSGDINETFDFSSDTQIVEGIFLALRTLQFVKQENRKSRFLSNEPELYKLEFKQRGIEKVMTSEGEVECYKVELVPKLGVIGVLKVFFPKTYFWFTVEAPHRWVKYMGYENGRNSPEVIMNVQNNIIPEE